MNIDKRCDNLNLLFQAFAFRHSFYVLGAGTSAPNIPLTQQLRNNIIHPFINFGSFNSVPSDFDALTYRIIGDPNDNANQFEAELLRRIPPSFVKAMTYKELMPKSFRDWPQYSVFDFANKPSTFFNLNVDGLAAYYCKGHTVLEPHGRIPATEVCNPWWDKIVYAALEWGIDVPEIPGVLLPQPEPKDITTKKEYSVAIKHFPQASYLVLIGYSFGMLGDKIDDSETFEFIRGLLRTHPMHVIVISPNPEEVAAAIQCAANLLTVYLFPIYWNHLSQAIIEIAYSHRCKRILHLKYLASKIMYRYDQLRDGKN